MLSFQYIYAVEESFDRDADGLPDFLGNRRVSHQGASMDAISPAATKIISGVISAVVAVTVFTNLGTQVLDKIMSMAGIEDILDGGDIGVAGGKRGSQSCLSLCSAYYSSFP